jgi:hypothetical protein
MLNAKWNRHRLNVKADGEKAKLYAKIVSSQKE